MTFAPTLCYLQAYCDEDGPHQAEESARELSYINKRV